MRKQLCITLIFFIFSCKEEMNIVGDWKASKLIINDDEIVDNPGFPTTYIKTDNIIIYFEQLFYYEIKNDTMFFFKEDEPDEVLTTKRIEIVDENSFILYYGRNEMNDSTNSINYIPYKSIWKKI